MAEEPKPLAKRRKSEPILQICKQFKTFSDRERFQRSYKRLCTDVSNALIASKITHCDADTNDDIGKSFAGASCRAKLDLSEGFSFGSVFQTGIQMLNDMMTSADCIFKDRLTETLLSTLLDYIFDETSQKELIALQEDDYVESESQVMTTLAGHFFGKLSATKCWTMDNHVPNKRSICKCGYCKVEDVQKYFGDTSVGCKSVWHGAVDILLGDDDIGINVCAEKDDDSLVGKTSGEAKGKDIDSLNTRSQVLAQTIVLSFLQRQTHPTRQHFITPFIAASNKRFKVFFYDTENDILLESRDFSYVLTLAGKSMINFEALIAAWFVVNYKYLCSGPTDMILKATKANFFIFAEARLHTYQSELRFRNVGEEKDKREFTDWDHLAVTDIRFICPETGPTPVVRIAVT